ncbi:MAG: M23 family metallopeptidase [Spirochaetaceae bacterium]|nr:M23 family metallopeptidase [Spirochaetaceae bacterium]
MEGRADRILPVGIVILSVILIAAQSGGWYLTKKATLERDYLHLPERWFEVLHQPRVVPAAVLPAGGAASAAWPLPIATMRYVAQPGDNLSLIKKRFGLTLDTLSSLNRDAGSGVHNVKIGEVFTIPNQDGLYLTVESRDHLETVAGDHGLAGSDVLAANPGDAQSVSGELFFPGAQNSGFERLLRMGLGFGRPLYGGWVSSPFGMRVHPFSGKWRMHRGVDIAAPHGTPVQAAADGRVERVASDGVLGRYVVIDHGARSYQTLYAHLSSVHVHVGELVSTGSTIGRVGSTGQSTGPHLHFELWSRRQPINPTSQVPGL